MARTRDYRAEYARRLAKGAAAGRSRQAARGHVEREHVRRAEHEREVYGITRAEEHSIRAWCDRFSNEKRDPDDVVEMAQEKGYAWFQNYRDIWNKARAEYKRASRSGRYRPGFTDYLDMLAEEADVPDVEWMYYH